MKLPILLFKAKPIESILPLISNQVLRSLSLLTTLVMFISIIFVFLVTLTSKVNAADAAWPSKTSYRYAAIQGKQIFYREAGEQHKQTIVLLHGYPSSSHTYRELIPLLSGRYHVIAPDYLGSGYSERPDPAEQKYTFDLLAKYVNGLLENLKVERYSLYIQDFGAPVGFRMLLNNPDKLDRLIVQNGNAYLAGLTPSRQAFFKQANQDRSQAQLDKLYSFTGEQAIINKQYLRDVPNNTAIMNPDSWTHDLHFLQTKKDRLIQVQLVQDYYNNLLDYPKWQAYLRKYQPPTLIVWGNKDPAFIAAGAQAYLKDVPKAELHLLDSGHFTVEEKPVKVAKYIVNFMEGSSSKIDK
ncbi:alpha/beta fold hydrolase [Paraglaciecola arctica]|uniref:Alpha/beta hydrolase fold protein n=1 Tax=Paraglaciecola arctica BSs20135 TaxID=493475 RepID=K6YMN4_9ALTE|nr:alpha/beta fold hydrolase [Paraglaciecola arctica]GAC17888.1 alpha/beta hydrolase fold protein [Paraglaciecola arctica BSs20135]